MMMGPAGAAQSQSSEIAMVGPMFVQRTGGSVDDLVGYATTPETLPEACAHCSPQSDIPPLR